MVELLKSTVSVSHSLYFIRKSFIVLMGELLYTCCTVIVMLHGKVEEKVNALAHVQYHGTLSLSLIFSVHMYICNKHNNQAKQRMLWCRCWYCFAHVGRDPFNQIFRKFWSKTEWISSVQTEKFRNSRPTFRAGPLFRLDRSDRNSLFHSIFLTDFQFLANTLLFITFHRCY